MKKLTRRLKKRRRHLLEHYDEEDLHQLRITLRRMRSRLKGAKSKELQQLRRDLGALAAATNAARDWDTLAVHARGLLSKQQYRAMSNWLDNHKEAARTRVLKLLRTPEWASTVERCKSALHHTDTPGSPASAAQPRAHALSRVAEARARALEHEAERDWHKLRIAIKELRYQLDEEPRKDRSKRVRQTIAACKQLQEELGTWHDTVVHRGLLATALEKAKGPENRALAVLDTRLSREGEACLDRVRALLVEPDVERTLSPGPR